MGFKKILFALLAVLFIVLAGCSVKGTSDAADGEGAELKLAYDTIPPTLDPHMSTATGTFDFATQIFEPLFAIDSKYVPQPMLAESYDMSDDGKTVTIKLREGVSFHNGKEMTAEDVIASMNRWKEVSISSKANLGDAKFESNGDYEVKITLAEKNPLIISTLANPQQFAAIMPKEIIESANADGITEYIGTGPFKVEEYKDTQQLHLKKFEDYSALDTPSDGLSGNKEAKVDDIYIDIVTDETIRFSGLQTGEYDLAFRLSYDNAEQLESGDSLKTFAETYGFQGMFFNKKDRFFVDNTARKAVNSALNMDEILTAAYTSEDYYNADPSLVNSDQKLWYNDAGKGEYNQNDPEKGKRLLKEAGYKGEEIVILATREYPTHYQAALVIQSQLEDIGMNVSLEVYDWATLLEHREDPGAWDIFVSGFNFEPLPAEGVYLHSRNEYAGWNNSPEIDSLVESIQHSKSQEDATKLFSELQAEIWDYLPFVLFGHHKPLHAMQADIEGFDVNYSMMLWNLEKK